MLFKLPQQLGFCFYDVPLAASPSRGLLSKSKKKKKTNLIIYFIIIIIHLGAEPKVETCVFFTCSCRVQRKWTWKAAMHVKAWRQKRVIMGMDNVVQVKNVPTPLGFLLLFCFYTLTFQRNRYYSRHRSHKRFHLTPFYLSLFPPSLLYYLLLLAITLCNTESGCDDPYNT